MDKPRPKHSGVDARHMMAERDAAQYLAMRPCTLKAWRNRGKGPPFYRYSGRCVRYMRADLDAWIAKGAAPVPDAD
jgi:hypothetical protein